MNSFKGISLSLLTQILSIFLVGLTSIILARYFGPQGAGIVAALGFVTLLSFQLSTFGLTGSNIFFAAKNNNDINKITLISFWFGVGGGIVSSAIIFLLIFLNPSILNNNISIILLLITLFSFPFYFIFGLFQSINIGIKDYLFYNFLIILTNLFLLTLILIVSSLKISIFFEILGITFTYVLLCVIVALHTFKKYKVKLSFEVDSVLLFSMLRYGMKSYVTCLLGFLTIQSNIIIINFFLGPEKLGVYVIAFTLVSFLLLIPNSIGNVIFSDVSSGSPYHYTQKILRCSFFLMLISAFSAACILKPFIILFYGDNFIESINIFVLLLPGVLVLGLNSIINQDLAGRGFPNILIISPLISFIFGLFLNFFLIPIMNINGAAISASLSYFVMFIITFFFYKNQSKSSIKELLVFKKEDYLELRNIFKNIMNLQNDTEKR